MRVRGFTLIELLVTLAILAVLASLAFPTAVLLERRYKEQELRLSLHKIRQALDAYKQAVDAGVIKRESISGYPPNLTILVEGTTRTSGGTKMYFLRRVPRDPFAKSEINPELSWGVRSYVSSPDQPKPGEDIYDVFSLSKESALDGSLYRSW